MGLMRQMMKIGNGITNLMKSFDIIAVEILD